MQINGRDAHPQKIIVKQYKGQMHKTLTHLISYGIVAFAIVSCTNFQEEEAPVNFGVDTNQLDFAIAPSTRSVTVSSGTKWDVSSMPSWVSLGAISRSGRSPYEWIANFSAVENDEYNREGKIIIKAGSDAVEISVTQEGRQGKYIAVESVSISPTELELFVGEIFTLSVIFLPDNATERSVTWTSTNTSVATVSSSGIITANTIGSTIIKAMTSDGKVSGVCYVTVVASDDLSVTEIVALPDNSSVKTLESTVVAKTTMGFVVSDGTSAIYAFDKGTNSVELGDVVKLCATKTTYNGVPELATLTSVEKTGTASVVHPTVKDITASVHNYTASFAEYIQFTGTLGVSGNYYNVVFEGDDIGIKLGSIVCPIDELDAKSFDGQVITVTGYFNGLSSGGKFINIIATEIKKSYAIPLAIDLGLSIKWASFNLGATKPEEYGDYYAWGEDYPRKLNFWPNNYKWFTLMYEESLTPKRCYYMIRKYVFESDYISGREPEGDDRLDCLLYVYPSSDTPPDNKETLDLEDDAAQSKLGDGWRIPTIEEWQELMDQCEWVQATINGIDGYTVSSKVNGNSFFIPYAGWVSGNTIIDQGSYGDYWSSSRSVSRPFVAKSISFGQSRGILSREAWHRYNGLSVRPVYTK